MLKELIKVIQQERYTYSDPITEFLECLYVNYDFEGAQKKLRECEELIVSDFFLGKQTSENGFVTIPLRDEFMENARLFIFETYCRIHQCIDIGMLSQKLNMNYDDAERWIVNLIRNARLDAKIDSKMGTVVMGTQHPNIYEQIIEKTKVLGQRSYALTTNVVMTSAAVTASAAR
jgi:translation initiation factor 3 subunit E